MTQIDSATMNSKRHAVTSHTPNGRISLAHGGGGQLTDELISGLILPRLGNNLLGGLLDSATLSATGKSFACPNCALLNASVRTIRLVNRNRVFFP